jgi:hypothetical protein
VPTVCAYVPCQPRDGKSEVACFKTATRQTVRQKRADDNPALQSLEPRNTQLLTATIPVAYSIFVLDRSWAKYKAPVGSI